MHNKEHEHEEHEHRMRMHRGKCKMHGMHGKNALNNIDVTSKISVKL